MLEYPCSFWKAAIKAPDCFQINSKFVRDCHQSLVKLAEHNKIHLVWAQGHMGIDENETAYQLAKQDSWLPLTWPQPSLDISAKVAKSEIRGWISRKHIHRQRQEKGFLKRQKNFETLCYKLEDHQFDFQRCHLTYSMIQSFWPHYGPVVNSAS